MKSAFNRFRKFYRQQQPEKKEQPFFVTKSTADRIQQKSDSAFFKEHDQDPYEKEADAVATTIVDNKSPNSVLQRNDISTIRRQAEEEEPVQTQKEEEEPVQKKEKEDKLMSRAEEETDKQAKTEEEEPVQTQKEEEEPVQKKEEEEKLKPKAEEEEIQKKPVNKQSSYSAKIGQKLNNTKGQGLSISEKTLLEMEKSFGYDFNQVKIHTDAESVQMNKKLHAQAFTHGKDIYFNSGKYNPDTNPGKRLLAHELTHVVQQGKTKQIQKKKGESTLIKTEKPFKLTLSKAALPRVTKMGDSTFATVYFDQNGFLLIGENFDVVKQFSEEIKLISDSQIVIDGHASKEGTEKHNQTLSENRRLAVISILNSQSYPFKKPEIIGNAYGERKPAVEESGKTPEELESQRKLNRRVEILITKKTGVEKLEEKKKPLDLIPKEKFKEETESDRLNRILKEKVPPPPEKKSVSELIDKKIDEKLNNLLGKMHVPKKYHEFLRDAAKGAIKSGVEKLFDTALDQTDLSGDKKKMIKKSIEGLIKTPVIK